MNTAGRFLLVGVLAVLIGGCASTDTGGTNFRGTVVGPGDSPVVGSIPWSGDDLQFFDHAITNLEEERKLRSEGSTDAASEAPEAAAGPEALETPADPAPAAQISLGGSASVREVVFAATFSDWDGGRETLVEADILEERAARHLDRVVLRVRGESVAGYVDVDSRRLPAALGLHWSGWERLGFGEWREPASQVEVRIPKHGAWSVSRGPVISSPLRESVTGGAVGRLAASVSPSESVEAPVIAWVEGLAVEGIPAQALPSQLALLVVPADAGTGLLVHVVLPFASERDARVAMVVSRLVVPGFLQEIGLEWGPSFGILREGKELYIVNVKVTHEQLRDVLAQGDNR